MEMYYSPRSFESYWRDCRVLDAEHEWKIDLREALDAIVHRDYATHQHYDIYANPGLQINSTHIALPLDDHHASVIKQAASRTHLASASDDLWAEGNAFELDPHAYNLSNPGWATSFDRIVSDAMKELGISETTIRVERSKLVLYEKGFSCIEHGSSRDDGIVARLIVSLPCSHLGGAILLDPHGKNSMINTTGTMFDLHAMAWYSEVDIVRQPITSGRRLDLVYNIIQTEEGPSGWASLCGVADELSTTHLKSILHRWEKEHPDADKVVYFLDRRYEGDICESHLEGRDKAVLKALQSLCRSGDYFVFLGNATRWDPVDRHGSGRVLVEQITRVPRFAIHFEQLNSAAGSPWCAHMDIWLAEVLGDPYKVLVRDGDHSGASAIVLIPKRGLQDWLMESEGYDIANFVEEEWRASSGHTPGASSLLISALMEATLENDSCFAEDVALVSWKIGDQQNFKAAIQSWGTGHGDDLIEFLASHTEAPEGDSVDWDAWLGPCIENYTTVADFARFRRFLSEFENQLSKLEGKESLLSSFRSWRPFAEVAFHASRPSVEAAALFVGGSNVQTATIYELVHRPRPQSSTGGKRALDDEQMADCKRPKTD